jgi:hypothetical protein
LLRLNELIKVSLRHYNRCQWLTPVILATQEAETWRIKVRSQPRKIAQNLEKKILHKKGLVECLKGVGLEFKP